jgi:L-ascorbate metabolism protein UlaG (beta-lactamase superfamily)
MMRKTFTAIVLALMTVGSMPQGIAAGPAHVDITWMSIANIHYELGPLRILTDGYISRIPEREFHGGGGGYAYTRHPWKPDVEAVSRVLDAIGGAREVNLLLTGHSHWDHSFDTATWSKLTNSQIIGSITTCFEVMAENIPAERCTPVYGLEKISLGEGVTLRVVRWNHSGDPAKNWEQHDPVELDTVPRPDPATGGLRAGVAEDFPNGGGNRGFLFTVDGPQGRFSWFYQNSASPVDLHVPIVINGVDYGAPIENLKIAMKDAGLQSVDLWIGTGGTPIAQLVVPVIRPKAYIPIHWDGLWEPFEGGMPWPFSDTALEEFLPKSGVKLLKPGQYMDKWRLDRSGIRPVANTRIKRALGFPEVQPFPR